MKNILVVVDMQNDFIDGSLGTKEAQSIVDNVVREIESRKYDEIFVTRDIHTDDYLHTREGKFLPIKHCISGTEGCCLNKKVGEAILACGKYVHYCIKSTFGSSILPYDLKKTIGTDSGQITFVGLCTDICVISNVLMTKAILPEVPIAVKANCCAGITPELHQAALDVMKSCQIEIK